MGRAPSRVDQLGELATGVCGYNEPFTNDAHLHGGLQGLSAISECGHRRVSRQGRLDRRALYNGRYFPLDSQYGYPLAALFARRHEAGLRKSRVQSRTRQWHAALQFRPRMEVHLSGRIPTIVEGSREARVYGEGN